MGKPTKHSLMHRLLLRFGWEFVDFQEQLPVYRDEFVFEVRDSGYYPPINPWRGRYGKRISTGFNLVQVRDYAVQTADPIPLTIDMDVAYKIDAQQCASQDILNTLIRSTPARRAAMAERFVKIAIQQVINQYTEEVVSSGNNRRRLTREIRHQIQAMAENFGIVVRGETAVTIHQITPPALITEARQLAHRRHIYANSVAQLPQDIVRDLHVQDLAQQSNDVQFAYIEHRSQAQEYKPYISVQNGAAAPQNNNHHTKEVIR